MPEIVVTTTSMGGRLHCGHTVRRGTRISKVYGLVPGKTTRAGNGPGVWMCPPCALEACRSAPDEPDHHADNGQHDQDRPQHEPVVPPPQKVSAHKPRKGQRSRTVKVPVVGGPSGRPRRIPNPATKRGWSIVKPVWMVPEPLDPVIRCGGYTYRLVYEGEKPYYVCQPEPAEVRRLRAIFTPSLGCSPSPSGP